MAIKGIPELSRKGNSIIFNGDILDIYIPIKNFESKLAVHNGEYIHSMGIFLFSIKTFDQADNNKSVRIHSMKLPLFIDFQYSSSFRYNGKLDNYPNEEYEVFRLNNNDQFIANVLIEKSSNNAVTYINSLHAGKIPTMLNYDEILQLYHETLTLSGVSLDSPSLIYELIISEACRSKSSIKKPFRVYINSAKEKDKYNYINTNINKLAMLNSTFAGLTFENMNDAILTSIERTQNNDEEKPSPLEDIARY